ncbi:MAG: serine/threonine-protein kinase [Myxococcaceae bacterium]
MAGEPSDEADDGVGPTRQRDLLVGHQLGEFKVLSALGEGGMGVVYRGVQPLIDRPVAIKVLKPGFEDQDASRLLDEARTVAAARHPNIIDIIGFGRTELGRPYVVMELLDGQALDLWVRDRELTTLEVVQLLKQLLSGLAAAHAAKVVHRDLKPGNLFIADLPDGTHHLKVLDFGLAKRVDPMAPDHTVGTVAGTPLYMSPEQIRGSGTGPFTDLYAFGCIAFELLSGRPPFSGSLFEILHAHQHQKPPALPPAVPPMLSEVIFQCLEKDIAARPASALAVRQVIERVERRLLASSGTSSALPSLNDEPEGDKARTDRFDPLKATPAPVPSAPRTSKSKPARPPDEDTEEDPDDKPTRRLITGDQKKISGVRPKPKVLDEPRRTTTAESARATSADATKPPLSQDITRPPLSRAPDTLPFQDSPFRAPARSRTPLIVAVVVAVIAVAAVAVKVLAPSPAVAPPPSEPKPVVLPPAPEVVAPPITPPPAPEPVVEVPPPAPAVAVEQPKTPDRPVVKTPRHAVSASKRLIDLEARCLKLKDDSRQRILLHDLAELRNDLKTMSDDDAHRALDEFEELLRKP